MRSSRRKKIKSIRNKQAIREKEEERNEGKRKEGGG